jgi:3',5'-cyclic-nucleotide phosphodiesterase
MGGMVSPGHRQKKAPVPTGFSCLVIEFILIVSPLEAPMKKNIFLIRLLKTVIVMVFCGMLIRHADFSCTSHFPKFVTIVLGSQGGLCEGDLSSFLVAKKGTASFVALDAGSINTGIREAKKKGCFRDLHVPADTKLTPEGWILRTCIKAYLVSHAHLDHVAGFVVNSTDDTGKPILGLDSTIDNMRDHIFNWKIWPNMANEGIRPIGSYAYARLQQGTRRPIEGTPLSVQPYLLSHSNGYPSTAFLLESEGSYLLFIGDTGPDALEGCDRLRELWTRVAPLVKSRKLRGIIMETAYPSEHPDELLFGHLTPRWVMKELHVLADLADPANPGKALLDLPVLVYHVKPLQVKGSPRRDVITRQLDELNDLGVRFEVVRQGQRIEL